VEIEMVVHDDDVDRVVDAIIRAARTGTPGDGHVSVIAVDHRYAIHTGHRDIC
jgi:nitrogen regulatory protein P-II 1